MKSKPIPLAGVIGSPIGHSKSPKLHGHWLKKHEIVGFYIPIELTHETFEQGLRALPMLGFKGVNVTIPFKEKALALADVVTDRAALIGAANTITFLKDGRIQADNTDGYGFIANLKQNAPEWDASSGPALVLGAGGAARAIVSALLSERAPEIILANRTRNRAEMLRDHFGARVRVVDWNGVLSSVAEAATLVNTTSLGMVGQPPLSVSLDKIQRGTLVTDIVYTPLKTPLLEQAEVHGCITVDGLGMLLHQAVPGFENWFRKKPIVDQELRQAVLAE